MLRFATPQDAPGLLEIYAPYVTGTIVSFEYDVPTLEEFARRIQDTTVRFPYLVWEEDGALLGYAYAHPYAARPAYQWSAELTVYLRQGAARRGLGSRLYGALFDFCGSRGCARCTVASPRRTPPAWRSTRRWASGRPGAFLRWAISTAAGWTCSGWKSPSPPPGSPSPWCPSPRWKKRPPPRCSAAGGKLAPNLPYTPGFARLFLFSGKPC